MEKTISPEERIRRAEEIYYRRQLQSNNRKSARVTVLGKTKNRSIKKMVLQITICIVIYFIFYIIQNTNYFFSEDIIRKTNNILSYNINLQELYKQGKEHIDKFIYNAKNILNITVKENNEDENNYETGINQENNEEILELQNTIDLNINDKKEDKNVQVDDNSNIGGGSIDYKSEDNQNVSQMEKDAKDILKDKSLIIPLKGTITSRFGIRNPETPTVPKNHTGIDIAANEGSVFIASMEGIVQEVSSERRFRKSRKNYKW